MIVAIWQSFRRMPAWVQLWIVVILMPVNMVSLAFVSQPGGALVAWLAIVAMMLNGPIMLVDRGFSKAMALPHVALWIPLVWVVIGLLRSGDGPAATYLVLLLAVDLVSLAFDIPDSIRWLKGERAAA